jgi:hypothetical protein
MLGLFFALLSAAAPSRSVTFEEAKASPAKRPAYLAAKLDPLVYDKDKNPAGLIRGWYFVPETSHGAAGCRCGACARAAIREVYKAEGREFYFERELPGILASLEAPTLRVLPYYSEDYGAAAQAKAGLVLVGDLFALGGEDEAASVLEDYALTVIKVREEGLKIEDRELDTNIPALKTIGHVSLIRLWGQLAQLEGILKGRRKVSDGFRQEAIRQYLATYRAFMTQFLKEKKIYDDNNENTLQKEIVDFLKVVLQAIDARVEAMGYRHKLLDKATQEHALEKK